MKVAIIGAGLAGLSCAIELEKHKIRPVIFEKRAHIGEAIDYAIVCPRILNRPIMDPLKYLKKEYGLELKPINHIKKMIMYSPKSKATERGSLGYIFRRGYTPIALEHQLLNYLKGPVTFNRYVEIEDVKNNFDYIVVATSNSIIATKLGVWTDTFISHARVATIVGKFKPTEIIMWLNTEYAKNGFCYIVPKSYTEACMVQIVNGITSYELDYYWKEFLFTENIQYYISTTTDTEHDCGFCRPRQKDNVLFTGNSAGLTDDLIGCGGLNAIESGVLAARAIAHGEDYNTLTQPIFEDIEKIHENRKALNTLDNSKLDSLVGALSLPVIKNIMYNNPFFRLSHASKSIRLYNSFVKNRRDSIQ